MLRLSRRVVLLASIASCGVEAATHIYIDGGNCANEGSDEADKNKSVDRAVLVSDQSGASEYQKSDRLLRDPLKLVNLVRDVARQLDTLPNKTYQEHLVITINNITVLIIWLFYFFHWKRRLRTTRKNGAFAPRRRCWRSARPIPLLSRRELDRWNAGLYSKH